MDQRWRTPAGTSVQRFGYGYDRNSNRLYKEDLVSTSHSEVYSYDGLNQLLGFERGTLNSTKTGITGTVSRSQEWDYDAIGNFAEQTTNGTGQTRTHNRQNEITSISGGTTPTYDANGNLTKDQTGSRFKYDAWNRLTSVGGDDFISATYYWDGTGRRVRENKEGSDTSLYYSSSWQVIEERVYDETTKTYAWSPVYIDAMIARDTATERLYVTQDANFNATALIDDGGSLVEQYEYDPYGLRSIFDNTWTPLSESAYAWVYNFQGGRWDQVAGVYSFRYRELNPVLGRWTTNDPIGYRDGSEQNCYKIMYNNPVVYSDSSGMLAIFFNGYAGPGGTAANYTYGEKEGIRICIGIIRSTGQCSKPLDSLAPGGNYEAIGAGGMSAPDTAKTNPSSLYNWVDKQFDYYEVGAAVEYIIKKLQKQQIVKDPIVIIGHSWGGASAIEAAKILNKKGYTVDFLATLDPITDTLMSLMGLTPADFINKNVTKAMNWYQNIDKIKGSYVSGAYNYLNVKDTIQGLYPTPEILKHTDFDDSPKIQKIILKENDAANNKVFGPKVDGLFD